MSAAKFLDRVTGKETQTPGWTRLAGRLVLATGTEVIANDVRLEIGDFVLPSSQDRLLIQADDGQEVVHRDFVFGQFPDRQERHSLSTIGKRLRDLEEQAAGWHAWCTVSPLVIGANMDRLRLTPFEQALQKYVWHLSRVSAHPRTQLTVEMERMPVRQARRIPARAYSYLAAHTEDWLYPKWSTVVPRRVLSMLPEDLLDFYENRLAARLTRETNTYLAERRAEVAELVEWKEDAERGTHWRQKRVYNLMAEAVSKTELTKYASHTQRILDGLSSTIMGVFDSVLYRAISSASRESVSAEARSTNILVNDRHYRFVNHLWRAFLKRGGPQKKSDTEIQRELQDYCRDFDHYVKLLVIRALAQLDYRPRPDSVGRPLFPGVTLELTGSCGPVLLRLDSTGTISLLREGQVCLRIVPLGAAITSHEKVEVVSAHIEEIYHSFRRADEVQKRKARRATVDPLMPQTVVVYPGSTHERQRLPPNLQRLACSPGQDLQHPLPVGLVPVRSYELGSVERIGRVIRWALLGTTLLSYPSEVQMPARYRQQLLDVSKWIAPGSAIDAVSVLRAPTNHELTQLQRIVRDLRGELVRKGQRANQSVIDRLDGLAGQLTTEIANLEGLRTCPICGLQARPDNFRPTDDNGYGCECSDQRCGTTWGVRTCNSCLNRYPFLRFGNVPGTVERSQSDWVDRHFGMDVLATPCAAEPESAHFICPHCGKCGRQHTGNPLCQDCVVFRDITPDI